MKISTKGRYALKVMCDIAVFQDDKNVSIMELSKRNNISDKYLEQIISALVKNNLLISFRGVQGGYKLSRPANKISIGEILSVTEGKLKTVNCISSGTKCDQEYKCLTVNFWNRLDKLIEDFLNKTTLEDVIKNKI